MNEILAAAAPLLMVMCLVLGLVTIWQDRRLRKLRSYYPNRIVVDREELVQLTLDAARTRLTQRRLDAALRELKKATEEAGMAGEDARSFLKNLRRELL